MKSSLGDKIYQALLTVLVMAMIVMCLNELRTINHELQIMNSRPIFGGTDQGGILYMCIVDRSKPPLITYECHPTLRH